MTTSSGPAAAAPAGSLKGRGPDGRMSFLQHLAELRRRLIYSLVIVFVAAIGCMAFAPQLFDWLRGPLLDLPHQKLIVLSPLELYITYLKLAVLAALFVAWPFILVQVWLFVAPGLYPKEKRWVAPFVLLGTVFFAGGALFAFYGVLPIAFRYVVTMMPETVEAQYSVAIYFSVVIKLMMAFGIVFELPLIMWILAAAGIVNPKTFARWRRYWMVLAFVVAALLTPPDPFTQSLMAMPLLAFYELGVLGARVMYRRHEKAAAAGAAAGTTRA